MLIDAGQYQVTFSAFLQSYNQSPADEASIVIEYRNAANTSVIASYTSGNTTYTSGWQQFTQTGTIPVDTRYVRVRLIGTSRNGSAVDAYFDNISLTAVSLLPVELTNFRVAATGNNVVVNWQTSNEVNNKGFHVQRSVDGSIWTSIAFVPAAGNNTTVKNYNFMDKAAIVGGNYYRLMQEDVDGKTKVSEARYVKIGGASGVSIFPNPVKDVINIRSLPPTATLAIVNAAGSVLSRYTRQNTLSVSSLAPGVYYLKVEDEGSVEMLKFMKL